MYIMHWQLLPVVLYMVWTYLLIKIGLESITGIKGRFEIVPYR